MTPTQQAAIAALEAKIAGYNGSPPAYLLMLLEQAKKEAAASPQQEQPQPQQEPTEPAPPKPSPLDALEAKIASYGDQKPPTYLTLLRDQARREQEDPRARFGRQVLQSTARGNMGLLDMASQAVQMGPLAIIDPTGMLTKGADKLTGLDVSGAVDKAYGEPVRAVGRSVRDFLFGDHGKAMTDAWDKTEAQLDAAHESDWNAAGKLERARMVATDLLAPTIPLGVGAKVAEKATAEVPEHIATMNRIFGAAASDRAGALERGAQLSYRQQVAIDEAASKITGGPTRDALNLAVTAANEGDTARFEELLGRHPELGPVADTVGEMQRYQGSLQDEAALLAGSERGMSRNGLRTPGVVSADTQKGFWWQRDKGSAAWSEAVDQAGRIRGTGREGGEAFMREAVRQGDVHIPTASEQNASAAGLRHQSLQMATADALSGILDDASAVVKYKVPSPLKRAQRVLEKDADVASIVGRSRRSRLPEITDQAGRSAEAATWAHLFRRREAVTDAGKEAQRLVSDVEEKGADLASVGEGQLGLAAERASKIAASVRERLRPPGRAGAVAARIESSADTAAWAHLFKKRAPKEALANAAANGRARIMDSVEELSRLGDEAVLGGSGRVADLAERITVEGSAMAAAEQKRVERLAARVEKIRKSFTRGVATEAQHGAERMAEDSLVARSQHIELLKSLIDAGRTPSQANATLRQMLDPSSEIFRNRAKYEAIVEIMPQWFKDKVKDARSVVALEALGRSHVPAKNAMAAARTFTTKIFNASVTQEVERALRGVAVFDEHEIPAHLAGSVKKVKENWLALKDKYVLPDVHAALTHVLDGSPTGPVARVAGLLGRAFRVTGLDPVLNAVDLSLNPAYIARNAAGAQLMVVGNGLTRYMNGAQRDALVAASALVSRRVETEALPGTQLVRKFLGVGDKKIKNVPTFETANELIESFHRHVKQSNMGGHDLAPQLDMLGVPTADRQLSGVGHALYAAGQAIRTPVRMGNAAIETADEIGRLMTYADNVASLVEQHGHPTSTQALEALRAEAGRITEDTYQNYAMMPQWIQELHRESPVLGRASYNLDVPRVMFGTIKQGLKEIFDGVTGRVANRGAAIKRGADRLAGIAAIASAGGLALSAVNGSDDKRGAAVARRGMGGMSDGDAVLVDDDNGRERTFNLSPILPYEPLVGTLRAMGRAAEGGDMGDVATALSKQLGGLFLQLRPSLQFVSEQMSGKDRWGREFVHEDAPDSANRAARLRHAADRLTPSPLRGVERTVADYIQGKTRMDPPVTERQYGGFVHSTDVGKQLSLESRDFAARAAWAYNHRDEKTLRELHAQAQSLLSDYRDRGLSGDSLAASWFGDSYGRKSDLLGLLYQPEWSNYNLWGE